MYALPGHKKRPTTEGKQARISRRSPLLERHPVLAPVLLLGSSVALVIASFSVDALFPLLASIGVHPALLCLLMAMVLGISGMLAGIVYIIERIDSYCLQHLRAGVFPQPKEHSYANRN